MNERLKNILSLVVRVVLSGALLWYLLSKTDTNRMMEAVRNADVMLLVYAGITFVAINFILFGRWLIFTKALNVGVPIRILLRYYFIGLFFNLFLPSSTGGDLVKALGVCQFTENKARVVATIVLDRLSGFVAIVAVALASFFLGSRVINDSSLLISIVVMAVFGILLFTVLLSERLFLFFSGIFNRIPRFKKSLLSMHNDIAMLKENPGSMVMAVGVSCITQIIFAFTFFLIARAIHHPIDFIYFLIFVPMVCVAGSLPSIGGLGVRDAGAAYLFAKVGIDPTITVSITLINFLFMILIGIAGGVVYVVNLSSGRLQHREAGSGACSEKA